MNQSKILKAIELAWEQGCPVASNPKTIEIVYNRYRGKLSNNPKIAIQLLTKKLIIEFEGGKKVGPLKVDYEYLAGKIVAAHNEGLA